MVLEFVEPPIQGVEKFVLSVDSVLQIRDCLVMRSHLVIDLVELVSQSLMSLMAVSSFVSNLLIESCIPLTDSDRP